MYRKSIVTLLALVCTAPLWAADTSDSKTAAQPTQEQVMQQFRDDLQAAAADVMAKGLTLNADQAAKFWPMFDAFQKEQKAIIDGQLKSLVTYRDTYKTMSDADALAYANSLLERDQKIHDLRVKYLAKFQPRASRRSRRARSSARCVAAISRPSRDLLAHGFRPRATGVHIIRRIVVIERSQTVDVAGVERLKPPADEIKRIERHALRYFTCMKAQTKYFTLNIPSKMAFRNITPEVDEA